VFVWKQNYILVDEYFFFCCTWIVNSADYETEDDTSDGVYPNQGNGTSQPLHFQATLKQDGNIAIEPGEFKATSTFQVTYP
ncbi:hypothetical protein OFN71_00730, partial [Escherichia coli]|nr:hypothetical protein [Escherichia coli]